MSHERLSFVHGDIRDAALVAELVAGVDVIVNAAAESHVEKSIEEGASEFVTTNVEGTQILLDAIRRTPVERFVLISSSEVYGTAETRSDGRAPPARAAQPVRRDEGRRRPARVQLLRHLRPADRDRAAVQQLRAAPASREGRAALHHAGAHRGAADDPRRRAREPRLALRRRSRRGDRGADRDAARRRRRRGRQRRDGRRHLGRRDRRSRARRRRRHRSRPTVHLPERLGQVDRHIGSTEKMESPHRLAGAHDLRRRARADGRLVPRERGLVAERPRSEPSTSPRPRRRRRRSSACSRRLAPRGLHGDRRRPRPAARPASRSRTSVR